MIQKNLRFMHSFEFFFINDFLNDQKLNLLMLRVRIEVVNNTGQNNKKF